MKNFGKSSRVHSQGVQKIFMAPIGYMGRIARSSLRQHSFLVIHSVHCIASIQRAVEMLKFQD